MLVMFFMCTLCMHPFCEPCLDVWNFSSFVTGSLFLHNKAMYRSRDITDLNTDRRSCQDLSFALDHHTSFRAARTFKDQI